jgi:hypothetical protein
MPEVAVGPPPQRRLIVVCRDDPSGRYAWIPPPRPGDVTIALDGLAHADLADRGPLLFDRLESWEERSAAEHRISELLLAIRTHPAVAMAKRAGHSLIELAAPRLRFELARLLRGWTLAHAAMGATESICDPAAPPALLMGVRAGLGLDPALTPYVVPPALPGSRAKRAMARPLMRLLGAGSRPEHIRVAAVATGKLSLALASLPSPELRAAGVGVMPFPGLDHGNSALLALRRRLPFLPTYGTPGSDSNPAVRLPDRLGLDEAPELDRALTLLVGRMLAGVAPELEQAVRALAPLERAGSLRAILLPTAAYGASRLLIEWARQRGIRVGAMQHGIYVLCGSDYSDQRADVVFGWGARTIDHARKWPDPRPAIVPVGVPGTTVARPRPSTDVLRRVLIATTDALDMPITPMGFCDAFIDTLAPGLRSLAAAGVEFALRPHPNEDPERYRRLLRASGLDVEVTVDGLFPAAVADADLLISSTSSVAFEAAALGVPVLLWLGVAPRWLRREHLMSPWFEMASGMFESVDDFRELAGGLVERPAEVFAVARELGLSLAGYAEPFDAARFAAGLHGLAA